MNLTNSIQEQEILVANQSFYQSFSMGDMSEMKRMWSQKFPVSCIHPGHPPLLDYEEIIKSWENILQKSGNVDIKCLDPSLSLYSQFALVTCYEEVSGNHLIATNGFIFEDDSWKMVLHQAGPTVGRPDIDTVDMESKFIN